MKNFLRDVGLDSEAGLKPAGIFRNAGIFDDAGLFISTISFLSDGYYFFDAQTLSAGNVTPWDGSLPDSPNDLGLIATQTTSGNQPTADGTVVIFDSNSEHYDIPSTSQAGWQIVGTSLGTFAYKVDADAITELNLLGNLGGATYRQAGDLYGIILLPDTATAAEVEAARQLLISRGAADGASVTDFSTFWRERADIVEFGLIDTSSVTDFSNAWRDCTSLTSFSTPLPTATNGFAAWLNCLALTSFSSELPSMTNVGYAWGGCSSLISFSVQLPSVTDARNAWQYCSALTSVSTELPLATYAYRAWFNCTSLTHFSVDVFSNWNPATIANNVFDDTWDGCTSLTPQSVENILVSIAASGKWATTNGASGGTALTDPEIDIDYDGTGLTTATNTAITTLKSRGWGIRINLLLQ